MSAMARRNDSTAAAAALRVLNGSRAALVLPSTAGFAGRGLGSVIDFGNSNTNNAFLDIMMGGGHGDAVRAREEGVGERERWEGDMGRKETGLRWTKIMRRQQRRNASGVAHVPTVCNVSG